MATKKTEDFVQNAVLRTRKETVISETNKDFYVKIAAGNF